METMIASAVRSLLQTYGINAEVAVGDGKVVMTASVAELARLAAKYGVKGAGQ